MQELFNNYLFRLQNDIDFLLINALFLSFFIGALCYVYMRRDGVPRAAAFVDAVVVAGAVVVVFAVASAGAEVFAVASAGAEVFAGVSAVAEVFAGVSAVAEAFAGLSAVAGVYAFVVLLYFIRRKGFIADTEQEELQGQSKDANLRYDRLRRQIEQEKDEEKRKELVQQEKELNATIEKLNARLGVIQRVALLDTAGNFSVSNAQQLLALAHNRLRETSDRLITRSKDNLRTGVGFTIGGFIVILVASFVVLYWGNINDKTDRFIAYLPFLTAGIALQIVGVFFLKTYRAIESDITQNKNEMTNIELRLAAILMMDKAQKPEVLKRLLSEERNFVLRKGETAITQREALTSKNLIDIIKPMLGKGTL